MKINTACWVNGCKCFNPNDEDGVWIKKDRDWVGLTPKEISEIAFLCQSENPSFFAHAVEDKLKEKNA